MKVIPIKRASTLFLKLVVVLIGAIGVLLSAIFLYMITDEMVEFPFHDAVQAFPQFTLWIYLGLAGLYAAAIPFFFALHQAFTLLQYIDKNTAFSDLSVQALRNIKSSAIAMSISYAAAMPLVFIFAQLDDAPGAVLFGLAFACAPLVVATFAAVLQKLVQNAIDLKLENDLTV